MVSTRLDLYKAKIDRNIHGGGRGRKRRKGRKKENISLDLCILRMDKITRKNE